MHICTHNILTTQHTYPPTHPLSHTQTHTHVHKHTHTHTHTHTRTHTHSHTLKRYLMSQHSPRGARRRCTSATQMLREPTSSQEETFPTSHEAARSTSCCRYDYLCLSLSFAEPTAHNKASQYYCWWANFDHHRQSPEHVGHIFWAVQQ